MSKRVAMIGLATLAGIAVASCSTTQERASGVGVGAVAGAAVGGPVGAVAGGVVGGVTGPSVASATGVPHNHVHHRVYKKKARVPQPPQQ